MIILIKDVMLIKQDNTNSTIKTTSLTLISCCSRNPFIEYGDIETDMEREKRNWIHTRAGMYPVVRIKSKN